MDINFLRWGYALCAAAVGFVGILVYGVKAYVPLSVRSTLIYGKSVERKDRFIVLELPKSYFKHFYVFGAPRLTAALLVAISTYFFHSQVPTLPCVILDILLGPSRKSLVGEEQTLLALLLFSFHLWKRLYESFRVTVYSDDKISVIHYVLGFIHYFSVSCCLVGESRGFFRHSKTNFLWGNLTVTDYVATVIFLGATFLQLHCNFILAALRKDKKDNVTQAYKIPYGGLFNYVTGALQFTEVVLYLMLSVILWKATTYHYVTIWVLVNETVMAMDSHVWYKKTFKDYPRDRKVIVPFVI